MLRSRDLEMILAWLRDLVSDRRHSGDVMKKRISTEGADRDYSESQSDPASKSAAAEPLRVVGPLGRLAVTPASSGPDSPLWRASS
jgi:hypothetical protein